MRPTLKELTLREKIGQTAMISSAEEHFFEVKNNPYGGIWSRGNLEVSTVNLKECSMDNGVTAQGFLQTVKKMNEQLKVPVLPSMDCLFGIQNAFREMSYIMDAPIIGAANSRELAYETGKCRALSLKAAGAKWWWGPKIDLENRNASVALGRKYSDNPEIVIRMAEAEIKGAQDNGVAATLKHFPGSDTLEYRDSHIAENVMRLSYDQWVNGQGRIFKTLIDKGVYSVMIGHTAWPAIDSTRKDGRYIPATVSKKIVTGILKEKMNFQGVVITDAIRMRSLLSMYDERIDLIYIDALNAGNDVILGVNSDYIDVVEKAVKDGIIAESRIDDACRRVLDMKEKIGMFQEGYLEHFMSEIPTPESANHLNAKVNDKVADHAMTLVCDEQKILPLDPKKIKRVSLICSMHDDKDFESLKCMEEELKKRGASVFVKRRLSSAEEIREISENSDLIIYVGYIYRYKPSGYSGLYGDEFETFNFTLLYGAEKSIGVSFGSPYMYFDYYSVFKTFVNAYNITPSAQRAFVKAIYGEIPFSKEEPFEIVPRELKI